jgi:hypothetical protein
MGNNMAILTASHKLTHLGYLRTSLNESRVLFFVVALNLPSKLLDTQFLCQLAVILGS